jgi:hypothetical protein
MRGIVAMLYKYFFTAKKKIHTLAHNDEGTLLDFENKNNEDGLSELKILVSVVRFRPGPPRITKTTFGWFFICLEWGCYLDL